MASMLSNMTRYFTDSSYTPTALLRRKLGETDSAFVNGIWRPTKSIIEWMFGENDFVDEISESEARAKFPAGAF